MSAKKTGTETNEQVHDVAKNDLEDDPNAETATASNEPVRFVHISYTIYNSSLRGTGTTYTISTAFHFGRSIAYFSG